MLAVEAYLEVVGFELDPQGMPLGPRDPFLDTIPAFAADDVQGRARTPDRPVKHHIVF